MLILNSEDIEHSINESKEQKILCCKYREHFYFKLKSYKPYQLEIAKRECKDLLDGKIQVRAIILKEPEVISVWLSSLEETKTQLKSEKDKVSTNTEKKVLTETEKESGKPAVTKRKIEPFVFLTSVGAIASILIGTSAVKLYQTSSRADVIKAKTASVLSSRPLNELKWPEMYVPSGVFNYGGSSAWNLIRKKVDTVIESEFPEFELRYLEHPIQPSGSNIGIRMLLKSQLAFVQSSRPLKPSEYKLAKQQGYYLKQIPIAIDGIAFAVHPNLNVPGLTVFQLRDIYLGRITNWQEVGGPNLEIRPYSRSHEVDGAVNYFLENVLEGEEKLPYQVQIVPTTKEGIETVANNLGAIYYGSASKIISTCNVKALPIGRTPDNYISPYVNSSDTVEECQANANQINSEAFREGTYPLTRILFAIVKKNGDLEEQAGIAYANLLLSEEGQKSIEKAGFVRIR